MVLHYREIPQTDVYLKQGPRCYAETQLN